MKEGKRIDNSSEPEKFLTKVLQRYIFFPSIFVTHDSVYFTDLNGMLDHYITGQATLRVGDWSLFIV